ncbi:GTP pyrophosphokinase [Proteiniclasticum sp.]|uniref:GTP pyrophosphokinase n=1 Tax=Proteiniclasticum sp. TaxID=2053595 RepID=UPI00289E3476|nr:GTP pyrophosphokinase [Proteiniclasticum sp.]
MDKKLLLSLPLFERALTLASVKHAGQKDKGNDPYVMHVIRVMMNVETESDKIVALLHDLLEDTDITKSDLLAFGFDEETVKKLDLLSRKDTEDYMDYIKRLSADPAAVRVKLSDLRDNLNRTRLKDKLTDKDFERLKKYHRAEVYLLEVQNEENRKR